MIAVADRLGAGVAKALLGKAALPDALPWVTGSIGLLGTKPSWDLMMECDADSEHIMSRRILRSRANQFAQEPESHVTMARSGRRGESSHTTRWGFTGLALTIARDSSVFHQSATPSSIFRLHDKSVFCVSSGSNSASVCALSPTRLTSIG